MGRRRQRWVQHVYISTVASVPKAMGRASPQSHLHTVLVVYVVVETGKKAAIRKRNIYEEAQQQRVLYVVAYSNILLCHL